jgi:outer membrane protein TolC
MGAPLGGNLQLAETLAQLAADTLTLATAPTAIRLELRVEDANLTLNTLNEARWQLRNRPTVSAYANYTLLHLNDGPNPFEAGTWFPFNYIGIRATAPLYDGRQAKLEAQDYTLRQQLNAINRQRIQADIDYEVQRQQKTLAQARIDWQQSRENTELARRLLAADRVRYEQGAIRQNELKNTELALKEAEDNQLTATYNLLLAHLNLQKALGL